MSDGFQKVEAICLVETGKPVDSAGIRKKKTIDRKGRPA